MTTYSWLNGASGSWTIPANWRVGTGVPVTVPNKDATAIIGAGTVAVDVAVIVAGLEMTGTANAPSEIEGAAQLTATGIVSFTGAVVQSGPGTTELDGNSTLIGGTAPGTLYLDGGRVLDNTGTLSLSGGVIDLGALPAGTAAGGGSLANGVHGVVLIEESGTVIAGGAGSTYVINSGIVSAQASGDAVITALFDNVGTLHVQTGTLTLADGGSSTGAGTKIDAGATLELSGGTFHMQTGIFADAGTVLIDGAVADLTGARVSAPTGGLIVSGSTLLLGAHATTIGTLEQLGTAGGSLLSSLSSLTVNGESVFTGIAVQTGKGTTFLDGNSTLGTSGTGPASLDLDQGRKLDNLGTLVVASGGIVLGANPLGVTAGGGSLTNGKLGVIDVSASGTFVAAGLTAGSFNNVGTVEINVAGVSAIGVSVSNHGTIDVQNGTLSLAAGGASLSRGIVVDAGATLALNGGTFTVSSGTLDLTGGLDITGGLLDLTRTRGAIVGGPVELSGGTLWLGARSATFGDFDQTGSGTTPATYSVVNGARAILVNGSASFSGVAVEKGPGTTRLMGETTLAAGASLFLDGGRTIENDGSFVAGGGTVLLGAEPGGTAAGDGYFTNLQTLDIQADGTVIAGIQGSAMVSNYGYLEKSAGTGTSTINAAIANVGTIAANSGTLALTGSVGGGSFDIGSAAVLDIGAAARGGTMSFIGGGGLLRIDDAPDFADSITGMGAGNQIDLAGFAWDVSARSNFATAVAGGGTLTITDAAGSVHLGFGTNYSAYSFTLASDGHGGLLIS